MKLRFLCVVISLLTACVFPSLALADESQEVKTYKAQCDQGRALACAVLGAMYDEGTGVKKDVAQAVAFYRKACDGRSPMGCSPSLMSAKRR